MAQNLIRKAPHHRWRSTFFELIVARVLQELGATIEVEQPNSEGKRPDFIARFPDTTVIIEAVSPVFNADAGETIKNRIPLFRIIESNIPQGWRVGVWGLPEIGPRDSKKEFEKVVKRMLSIPPPTEGTKVIELFAEISTGIIRLSLLPGDRKPHRLMWEATVTAFDDSEERIRFALKRKRNQVRNSDRPVLLAVEASGISSEYEDFDNALFGHTYEAYDIKRQLTERGFKTDGVFSTQSHKAPTYAGVLAFLQVGFLGGLGPVLYKHPRFSGILPESMLKFEQRSYDKAKNSIQIIPAREDVMGLLKFVQ
jgi:hypothetical protein